MWSANFLGGKKRDEYNEPINAEQGWWESGGGVEGAEGKGLRGLVEEMLVVGGGDEILLDSIRVMMVRLEVSYLPFSSNLISYLSFLYESLVGAFCFGGVGCSLSSPYVNHLIF